MPKSKQERHAAKVAKVHVELATREYTKGDGVSGAGHYYIVVGMCWNLGPQCKPIVCKEEKLGKDDLNRQQQKNAGTANKCTACEGKYDREPLRTLNLNEVIKSKAETMHKVPKTSE